MATRTSDIRILLLGDAAVGKSSILSSLVNDAFIPNLQHVLPEVTIPPDWLKEKITTRIVDSSSKAENKATLDAEILLADVICLIYSISNPDSFDRIPSFWLPYIRKTGRQIPIILVGNKIDLRGSDFTNDFLSDQILPIMNEFKEVETCIECSAKLKFNIGEVFYFAQKAVLYPTAPLYDSKAHCLKPKCVEALSRVFTLSDFGKDGVLDDAEIFEFQGKCFGVPLQVKELESIKSVVLDQFPEGITSEGHLTLDGFLFLNMQFIQKGRLETTWTVLRKFGYGDDLELLDEYLIPEYNVPNECSVELSSEGYQFFTDLFQTFDKDKDGALNKHELESLFSTAPCNPWLSETINGVLESALTNQYGAITLQGFLAQWSMTTLLSHETTLSYLAYLGFPSDSREALKMSTPKSVEIRRGRSVQRNVFLCYVVGGVGSGKTSILNGLIGKPWNSETGVVGGGKRERRVVNSVEIGGAEKYLVMQEFEPGYDREIFSNKKKMDACDLILFVYDSSDANSFAYVANLRNQFNLEIPSVFVATKSDLDFVSQRYEVQPDTYCRNLGLSVPINVSMKESQYSDLFSLLVGVGLDPSVAIPGYKSKKEKYSRMQRYVAVGAVSCVVVLTAVFLQYKFRVSQ